MKVRIKILNKIIKYLMSLRKSVNFNLEDGGPKSSSLTKPKIYSQDNLFGLEQDIISFEASSRPFRIEEDKKVLPYKKLKSVNNIFDFAEYTEEEEDFPSLQAYKGKSYKSSKNISEIKKIQTRKKSYREDINSINQVNPIKPLEPISDSPNSIDESKGANTTVENIRNYHQHTIEKMRKIQNLQIPKNVTRYLDLVIEENNKRFAVLGLEDTLVHYEVDPRTNSFDRLVVLPNKTKIGINFRPFLKEALEEISKKYHLILISTNEQTIAESVVDAIDPNKNIFSRVLFVDHCTKISINQEKFNIKDLRMFKFLPTNKIVIIDTSVISFAFQISNGIPILPYVNSKSDNELKILVTYLNHLSQCDDIQEENRKVFKLESLIPNDNLDSSGLYHLADSSKDEESDEKRSKSLELDGNTSKFQRIEPIKPLHNFNFNSLRNVNFSNNFNSNSSYESNSLLSCLVLLNKGKDYDSVYNTLISSDFSGVDWEHSAK